MFDSRYEHHCRIANGFLLDVEISGHLVDMLGVMVRATVKKSTDMALVKESLGTGFRLGSDFREQDSDFIDIAAEVNKSEPAEQIVWLLESDVPKKDIRTLIRTAVADIDRARKFLNGRELTTPTLEYIIHTFFDTVEKKASNYCDIRQVKWNAVYDLARERAHDVFARGVLEQITWLLKNGHSEQDLNTGLEDYAVNWDGPKVRNKTENQNPEPE